ncbi:MAG: endonuclease/exonuclease/phosphatase family protein [bacterium]
MKSFSLPALSCVPLLVLCLACQTEADRTTRAPPAALDTLRILDINVWSGLDYQGNVWMGEYETKTVREKRYQALVHQIKAMSPDIIGVQEANKLPGYADRLAGDLGYDVFFHVGIGGVRLGPVGLPWNLREGDAILTRKDLRAEFAGRQQLSGGHVGNFFTFHFSDATQVIAVKVINKGTPLYVFVTHWHASMLATAQIKQKAEDLTSRGLATPENRRQVLEQIKAGQAWRLSEAEKTLAFIQKTAGPHPSILMGDFNATDEAREIKNLVEFGLLDTFQKVHPQAPGFTWDPDRNRNYQTHYLSRHEAQESQTLDLYTVLKRMHEATPKRIDYVFVRQSPGISVSDSRVVLDEVIDGVHASDHFGVYAEILYSVREPD